MDFRALTAPPDHGRPQALSPCPPSEQSERHTQSDRRDPSTPSTNSDSIELAAASLFSRVRAIITPRRDGTNDDRSTSELPDDAHGEDNSPAGSTTPYYADEGESGGSGSNVGSLSNASATRSQTDGGSRISSSWLRYTSEAVVYPYTSSPDSAAIQVKSGPARSIVASTVAENEATAFRRPEFLHSSTDQVYKIHKNTPERTSKRALGRVTPSPIASKIGVVGRGDSYPSSEDERVEDDRAGDGDHQSLQRKLLNRAPSGPVHVAEPVVTNVVYDSTSSSRTMPDLFPRPFHPYSPERRPADTPINSLASPKPLIGIIPPTPAVVTSASEAEDTGEETKSFGDARRFEHEVTSTVVAHTGASTPEDHPEEVQTFEKGTMTEFVYGDSDQEDPGDGQSAVGNVLTAEEAQRNSGDWRTSEGLAKAYSSDAFAALSSYDDTDIPRGRQSGNLHEEYLRLGSWPSTRNNSADPRRRDSSRDRGHKVTGRANIPRDTAAAMVPIPFNSFTGLITDLEQMLNQALELAGRAVDDSNMALEERDASVSMQSARESATSSMQGTIRSNPSSRPSMLLDRVVTAPESAVSICESLPLINFDEDPRKAEETLERINEPFAPTVPAETKPRKVFGPPLEQPVEQKAAPESTVPLPEPRSTTVPQNKNTDAKTVPARQKSQSLQVGSSTGRGGTSKSSKNSFTRSSSSYVGNEDKFRMEVGRSGEIMLVKIPQSPEIPESPIYPQTRPAMPEDEGSKRPYTGGWQWGLAGKRFVATVACAVVGLIGWLVGNYHAEEPAIQEHLLVSTRVVALGNSMLFLGLAIPTFFLWPLSLLHGRKPYLVVSMALLLPLQLPQALSLPPYTSPTRNAGNTMTPYIVCLLFFRSISGLILGLGFMNTLATLIDVFGPDTGACCRGGVVYSSRIPVEGLTQYSNVPGGEAGVRMGIWLGIFTWMFVASPAVGYLFGKLTIARTTPAWGFWIILILGAVLLVFIVPGPEVRPPWSKSKILQRRRRRSRGARRAKEIVERGEVKMVVFGSSPRWWWEEVWAGLFLSWTMVKQIGFAMIALYCGWVFGHLMMVMRLLAYLLADEDNYAFSQRQTGLAVLGMALGALASIPVQLSTFYITNFRHRSLFTLHNTKYGHRHQGAHPYRHALYIGGMMLPITSMALTVSAGGLPTNYIAPIVFAALVSFSGTLVIAECHILLMDNYDISDLPEIALSSISGSTSQGASTNGLPHGTQRPIVIDNPDTPDNFTTCHPTITSGFAIFHGLCFAFAAAAVGFSTYIIDGCGIRNGMGIYTGLTTLLTLALALVLWRRKRAKMLEVFNAEDRTGMGPTNNKPKRCKISLLQQGKLSRWSEVNGMEYDGMEGRV